MVSRNAKDNILSGLLLVLKMFSDIIIFQFDTLTIVRWQQTTRTLHISGYSSPQLRTILS